MIAWILGLGVALKLVTAVSGGLFRHDDFEMRYHSARRLLHRIDPYQLDSVSRSNSTTQSDLPTDGVTVGADYFPSALLPMFPLALLNLNTARFAWVVISLGCAAVFARQSIQAIQASGGTLTNIGGLDARVLAITLWVTSASFTNHLRLGQNCLFALAFGIGAVHLARSRRPVAAGVCLTLALFKYAYIWPVLLILMLDRAWKTLALSAAIHLGTHLILSRWISVGPVDLVREVLQLNARVFHRNNTLTFWYPFRKLAAVLPEGMVPADFLGGAALLVAILLLGVWWRRDRSRRHDAAWILVLGNLSTLSVPAKGYQLLYLLPGWLWCFRDWPSPRSRGWRWILAGSMFAIGTLTGYLRRAEVRLAQHPDAPLSAAFFNLSLALLCISSAVLLYREIWPDSEPPVPASVAPIQE